MKGKIFKAQEVQAIIAGNKTQFREDKFEASPWVWRVTMEVVK